MPAAMTRLINTLREEERRMVAVMKGVSDCCSKDGWGLLSEEEMDEREKIEMLFERN